MTRKAVAVGIAYLATIGCATIMHGTKQQVGISSQPTGAMVAVDGQEKGKTPVAVELSRKEKHLVKIDLGGYKPFEMYLTKKASGWAWGNLIFGGIPGLAIDAITGGLYILQPEQVAATMQTASITRSKGGLYIVTVLVPDPTWQKVAQLEPR